MYKIVLFLKRNMLKVLVALGICAILYYSFNSKNANIKNRENSLDNFSRVSGSQDQINQKEYKNGMEILNGKPLPIGTQDDKKNSNAAAVNNVKVAELKQDEQLIILEDNPGQSGSDVVLAAKGIRAKWVFRFKDGKPCNGKILIERFGMILPVLQNELSMTFAPWKDFVVTCDKGKFNYYIKVVDKLYPTADTKVQANKAQKENIKKQPAHRMHPKLKVRAAQPMCSCHLRLKMILVLDRNHHLIRKTQIKSRQIKRNLGFWIIFSITIIEGKMQYP